MTGPVNSRGICDKSLRLQMRRKSRLTNSRHPYLSELDSRFYESLDFVNFRPKNIFSIDMFPGLKNKPKNSFFSKVNWFEGSFLPKERELFKKNFFKNLYPFSKNKEIFYPLKNNHYCFSDNSFDYIEALAVIPWANNPLSLINEIHRLLKSGGFFGFASFGPGTLKSLIALLNEKNTDAANNNFITMIDMHDIGDFCSSAGFVSPVVASNTVCFKYSKAETALDELRVMSGNPRLDRDGFLRGKNWYVKIIDALNNCKDSDGFVTLEFELIYGHAWKVEKNPEEIKKAPKFVEKKIKIY